MPLDKPNPPKRAHYVPNCSECDVRMEEREQLASCMPYYLCTRCGRSMMPDGKMAWRVETPLGRGRSMVMWLPKPPGQLTAMEVHEIEQSLTRTVKRNTRGQA
jgi:hypothetical protein